MPISIVNFSRKERRSCGENGRSQGWKLAVQGMKDDYPKGIVEGKMVSIVQKGWFQILNHY